ncbi:MAG: hypothetical protein EA426_09180 [Spirochaetaceae bacterium]|nr:MAG: hypothetical protein EA426_09180 [Spirochaetaceae bacterium]
MAQPIGQTEKHEVVLAVAEENRALLIQLDRVLAGIPAKTYTAAEGAFRRGGVGKHVRHVLEFYQSVLNEFPEVIDYDSRTRESEIEENPSAARERIRRLVSRIADLRTRIENRSHDSIAKLLRFSSERPLGTVPTSVGRELVFLSSHTVHHLALIRFILESQGYELPDEFGVAPSTLRYEKKG